MPKAAEEAAVKQQEAAAAAKEAKAEAKEAKEEVKAKEVEEKPKAKPEEKPVAERLLMVPLRRAYDAPLSKRAAYARTMVKQFVGKHLKASTVKLSAELNRTIWSRGLHKPPARIRVLAKKYASGEVMAEVGH